MTHPVARAVAITWRRNGAYAQRLVNDLQDSQWLAQPVTGRLMNHPAWVLSHLTVYAPIVTAMLTRTPFEDPLDHPFGQRSKVSANPADYPHPREIFSRYVSTHEEAEQALLSADDAVFDIPTPLPRWREVNPTVGDMMVTLMVKHESGHLGQLSAWRRALGLPSVAM